MGDGRMSERRANRLQRLACRTRWLGPVRCFYGPGHGRTRIVNGSMSWSTRLWRIISGVHRALHIRKLRPGVAYAGRPASSIGQLSFHLAGEETQ